ncbi:Rha family transcriptional regulator [Neorhizobium galegae]
MFHEATYKVDGQLKSYRCLELTRDGFTLLAMGFTGEAAARTGDR